MKVKYDSDVDILCIILDFNHGGNIIGIEIPQASRRIDNHPVNDHTIH